jgi:translation initiation factor 2 beta subunit (eIF-2beta)/eIF-5
VLESDARCQRLNLQSFFALPMQRVTRLPLLLDAIYKNLKRDDPSYEAVKQCLTTLHEVSVHCCPVNTNLSAIRFAFGVLKVKFVNKNIIKRISRYVKLAKNCNECKRTMENAEEVAHLRTLLDFSKVKVST